METIARFKPRTPITLADAWAAMHAVHVRTRGLPLSAVQAHELFNALDRAWCAVGTVEQARSDTAERVRTAREACHWLLATVMMPVLLDLVDQESDGAHRAAAETLVLRAEGRLASSASFLGLDAGSHPDAAA